MEFVTEVKNQGTLNALFQLAKANDIEVCSTYKSSGAERWPYFVFDPSRPKVIGSRSTEGNRLKLSLEEMMAKLVGYTAPVTLQLTSDYTAVVHIKEKIVEVGCQKIPFDKVKELYELISK